jgi:protocatechuate 4,5-dioxygenase, alpha chain
MPMTREQQAYDDIPGTFVFDAERSRRGYGINMFCMSLMKAENRKAFKENEAKYLDRFQLTPDQRDAILKRQYNRMLELGGNIYFTAKLGATDGHSFQHMAAIMTSSTQDDYAKMMLGGGRSVEGNRSKTGKAPIPSYDRAAKKPKKAKKAAKSKKAAKAKSTKTKSVKKSVKKSAKSVKKAKARQLAKTKTKAKTTKKTKARSKARSTRG